VSESRKYCYPSVECRGDVFVNVGGYVAAEQGLVVDMKECCSSLGGFSWGLCGDKCEVCPSTQSGSSDDTPDVLQGWYLVYINIIVVTLFALCLVD